eukprot:3946163-Pleurochrysis_carterae.AAC.4
MARAKCDYWKRLANELTTTPSVCAAGCAGRPNCVVAVSSCAIATGRACGRRGSASPLVRSASGQGMIRTTGRVALSPGRARNNFATWETCMLAKQFCKK